jgi:hypothetical protein
MSEPTKTPGVPGEPSRAAAPAGYEAPRVEQVLTQEKLEAEVLYAGQPAPSAEL